MSSSSAGAATATPDDPLPSSTEMQFVEILGVAPSGVVLIAEEPTDEIETKHSSHQKEPSDEINPSPCEKPAEMDESTGMLELMVRVDPSGFLFFLGLVSALYAALVLWLTWRVADRPAALFWTPSLLAWFFTFVWTISLSESTQAVLSRFSCILLLACAANHLIGPLNGMVVMYLGTFYAAGMLGYAVAEHSQRVGVERSGDAVVPPVLESSDDLKSCEAGEGLLLCVIIFMFLLPSLARITCVIFIPDTSHRNLLEAFELVIEIWCQVCMSCGMLIVYVTEFELRGALLSLDTFARAAPSFLCGWFLPGMLLSLVVGEALATFFLWFGTVAIVGFFGYALAVRARYKQIQAARCTDEGQLTTEEEEKNVVLVLGQCQTELKVVLSRQGQSSKVGSSVEVEHILPFGPRAAPNELVEAVVEPNALAILPRPTPPRPRAPRRKKSSPTATTRCSCRLVVLPSATLTAVAKAQRLITEKLGIAVEPEDDINKYKSAFDAPLSDTLIEALKAMAVAQPADKKKKPGFSEW